MLKRVIVFACLISLGAWAQTAGVQGVVQDTTAAVIGGAEVTLTNMDTGVGVKGRTNDSGFYTFPVVPIGNYKIEASRSGFGSSEHLGLKLDVNQLARIDFTLKPGSLQETVNVSAAAALLDSETSTVGQVIDNKRIVELPLNGRNYLDLAKLAVGTAPSRGGRTASEGGFVASGQHGYQLAINLDGLDNSSVSSGGPLGFEAQAVKPSVDAVSEFRVVTNNLSAEYGGRMGGQVFITVKSGTNQLHGSAFEFLRNNALDGTNFFANRSGAPQPEYRQNQFGGTGGGPIVRDRTFLFGSYEGTRIRLGESFTSTVPTLAERNGDFSAIRPIYDPATTVGTAASFTRQPFPGGVIPRNRWDPLFPKLLALYPAPIDNGIVNNYFSSPVEQNQTNSYDFKGDHNLSDRSRFFVRYSRRDRFDVQPGPFAPPADGGLGTTTDLNNQSIVASQTQTIGSTFTNEARFGFSRMVTRFDIPFDKPLYDEFGIKGIPKTYLASSNDHGLTRFTPAGYAEIGARSFWPNANNLDLFQFTDVAYKNAGKHNIKFGGEFKFENIFRNAARYSRGQMAFNREFTANPANRAGTGDGLAEFMLGLAAGGMLGNEQGENLNDKYVAFYVQDDWKASPRLTLNLGVRYDVFFAPVFPDGGVANFTLDLANTGPNARLQEYLFKPGDCQCKNDLNNFAPRLGLAYRLTAKTVLRAGAGVIYAHPDSENTQWARGSNQSPTNAEYSFATTDRINARLILKDGFPPVTFPAPDVPGPNQVGIAAQSAYLPTQYSQQWFFDVQRELPLDTLLTAGYAGNGTRQLIVGLDYNLPFGPSPLPIAGRRIWPYYNGVTVQQAIGNLSFNAFTAKLEKRFSRGMTFLSSYTWAHTIDDVDENLNQTGGDGAVDPHNLRLNRGNSVSDVRHQYALSATYELPAGKGKRFLNRGGFVDYVLGGWQLGGIYSHRSGLTFTVTDSGGITNAGGADRPNRIGRGDLAADRRSIDHWFDVGAFQVQPQYTYGNSGRNILFGPSLNNVDFSLAKFFAITERARLQLRCESFNLTNTPAFNPPNANITGAGPGAITGAGEPRRIQFALKLLW